MTNTAPETPDVACANCGKPVDFRKPHAFEATATADENYCTACTTTGKVRRPPLDPQRLDAIKSRRGQRPTPPKPDTPKPDAGNRP